jgi:hypothetical protein
VLEAEHVYCPEAVLSTLENGSTTLVSEIKYKCLMKENSLTENDVTNIQCKNTKSFKT